jgi:hypothetical protein
MAAKKFVYIHTLGRKLKIKKYSKANNHEGKQKLKQVIIIGI